MKLKNKITLLFTLFLITVSFSKDKRPNILFILCDDLGYSDVGFNRTDEFPKEYGVIPTPELDKLATDGVIFTDAYVAHPFCGPSRAAIMTGKYPHRYGSPYNLPNNTIDKRGISKDHKFISKMLQENGYYTGALGKWHLGIADEYHPNQRGFDHFFGFLGGGHDYFPERYRKIYKWQYNKFEQELKKAKAAGKVSEDVTVKDFKSFNEYMTPFNVNGKEYFEEGNKYVTDILTDEAINFIEKGSEKEEPFFLYLAYNAPHTPIQAPKAEIEKFKKENPNFLDLVKNSPDILSARKPKKKKMSEKEYKEELVKTRLTYATMVSIVDRGVGKIVQTLKDKNQLDNTLIVFLSDNGGKLRHAGATNYPLSEGKGSVDEGGFRVPMFMHWPKQIQKNQIHIYPISALDFYPTFASLAKAKIKNKKSFDGKNVMKNILEGTNARENESIYALRHLKGFSTVSIRKGSFKVVRKGKQDWSVFNIDQDISQKNDLRNTSKEIEKIVKEYVTEAKEWSGTHTEPQWFDAKIVKKNWTKFQMPRYDETFSLEAIK